MKITAKIGLTNRGLYEETAEYDILDFVASGNALWISRREGNKGNALTDGRWWQRAIHGSDGITEKEINDILADYWKKTELSSMPDDIINNLK